LCWACCNCTCNASISHAYARLSPTTAARHNGCMEAIDTTSFFRRDGDLFIPSSFAVGPWDPNSMHGRVLGGLLGREMEQRYCDDDFQFTRLTVDLFRLPPLEPVEVRSELVREGNRIRVADATVLCGGVEMARGRGVMLRRAEQPPGDVWRPP